MPTDASDKAARTRLLAVAITLFVLGLIAVCIVFVLYATGHHDLPFWLSVAAMLLPVGLAVGGYAVLRR